MDAFDTIFDEALVGMAAGHAMPRRSGADAKVPTQTIADARQPRNTNPAATPGDETSGRTRTKKCPPRRANSQMPSSLPIPKAPAKARAAARLDTSTIAIQQQPTNPRSRAANGKAKRGSGTDPNPPSRSTIPAATPGDEAIVVAKPMHRPPRRIHSAQADGGGQTSGELHTDRAPADNSARHHDRENQGLIARGETDGQPAGETQKLIAIGLETFSGHPVCENQRAIAAGEDDGGGRGGFEPQSLNAPAIAEIRSLWRMRQRWHRAEKSLILQGKAICRAFCDSDKDAANAAFDAAAGGTIEVPIEITVALVPFLPAIERFASERKAIEKRMLKLAKELPAYAWMKSVRGFGELNFVGIVGECGDIGSYKSVSALWKRMGLAVINGERQRKCADAELAILHGYNPSRRAVAFNLGDCVIRAGTGGNNAPTEYKEIYINRKDYEVARDPEIRPIHAHRRAARYMVKRLLRTLYSVWRKAVRDAHA